MNHDALFESRLGSLSLLHRGKVRDNYAIGSDRNAAFLSGVAIARSQVTAYAVGGFFAGLAGLVRARAREAGWL